MVFETIELCPGELELILKQSESRLTATFYRELVIRAFQSRGSLSHQNLWFAEVQMSPNIFKEDIFLD